MSIFAKKILPIIMAIIVATIITVSMNRDLVMAMIFKALIHQILKVTLK